MKWYQKNWVILIWLILFFPVALWGLLLRVFDWAEVENKKLEVQKAAQKPIVQQEKNKIKTNKYKAQKIKQNNSGPVFLCPYCSSPLNKQPLRKTKCPHCGQYMLVRTHPKDRLQIVVTEEQARDIEYQWSMVNLLGPVRQFSSTQISKEKNSLQKSINGDVSDNEAIRSILTREAKKHFAAGEYGLYRNDIFDSAATFLKDMMPEKALNKLWLVYFIDINGPNNSGSYNPREGIIIPLVVSVIYSLINYLKMDMDKAKENFISCTEKINLPVSQDAAWKKLLGAE